jgi:hypothetical protein
MRETLARLSVVAVLLGAGHPANADEATKAAPWVTVEPGRHWILVGEWDQHSSGGIRSTLSILQMHDDTYVLVWDATVVVGCCNWPAAERLRRSSESTYVSEWSGSEFTVLADRHLRIEKAQGGGERTLPETPLDERFSSRWK